MNCRKVQKLLSPYHDRALKPELQQQVALHLQQCPACAGEQALLEQTLAAVRTPLPPAPDQWLQISQAIEQAKPQPALWINLQELAAGLFRPLRLAGACAMACVIVTAALLLKRPKQNDADLAQFLYEQLSAISLEDTTDQSQAMLSSLDEQLAMFAENGNSQ